MTASPNACARISGRFSSSRCRFSYQGKTSSSMKRLSAILRLHDSVPNYSIYMGVLSGNRISISFNRRPHTYLRSNRHHSLDAVGPGRRHWSLSRPRKCCPWRGIVYDRILSLRAVSTEGQRRPGICQENIAMTLPGAARIDRQTSVRFTHLYVDCREPTPPFAIGTSA